MKKMAFATAAFCVAAISLSRCAMAAQWFDAGVSTYTSWSEDGSDRTVAGAGSWRGTANAALEGEPPTSRLAVVTSGDCESLAFEPAVSKRIGTGVTAVTTSMRFTAAVENPPPDSVSKAGITVVERDGSLAYVGLAAIESAETGAWTELSGAIPDLDRDVVVEVSFMKTDGVPYVRYSVDGTVLTAGGAEWLRIALSRQNEDVSRIAYEGAGEVAALSGASDSFPETSLFIPVIQGVASTSVTVAGVSVARNEDGTYTVESGSNVEVAFTADEGYVLSWRTMMFRAEGDTASLPSEGRPVAIPAAGSLRVNEVSASNGKSAVNSAGTEGLDWAEIANMTDFDIDISGWSVTDDPTKKISKWKTVEGPALVPAHGYLVVWLDNTEGATWPAADAHAAIGLSASGEAIGLATPEGTVVSQFEFGQQIKDVSLGWGRLAETVLSETDNAEYRVGGGEWKGVNGPIGMSGSSSGFTVTSYKMADGVYVNSLEDAEKYIADSKYWARQPSVSTRTTIAFQEGDAQTNFAPYTLFPGASGDHFVITVEGDVFIPESGQWTFAVGSDDGFSLELSRLGRTWSSEVSWARGYEATTGTFALPAAGVYHVRLVYFENGGAASLDFSVAKGSVDFDPAVFRLVGSAESGVLHAGAFGSYIAADLSDEMAGKSATAEWRGSFTLADAPADGDAFRLRIRYADGFVARLNGTEIARADVSGARTPVESLSWSWYDIPAGIARQGDNLLEIAGVNNSAFDADFFLSSEVIRVVDGERLLYFPSPTPGAVNGGDGRTAPTPVVSFSVPHGWKTGAFDLELSCEDPGAAIYYTTDGTSPTTRSARYTGPVHVSSTTAFRAAVLDHDTILQRDSSATYLFVEDVVRQDENPPPGFPASEAVNGQRMRYGMARNVVNGADAVRLRNGFTNSICTISLVVDPASLFSAERGIYVNAVNDGKGWERQTMVEQIDPVNGDANGFSVPAGLRIRGAYSRGADKAKHSFRLFFRSEYGMGKLEFPLFGDEGAGEFQKVDLRTSQNYSWSNENSWEDTFIHECFSRDSQRDMGEPYNRSRYYNLFINGVYWGLYQAEERADSDFGATYFGGEAEDYDVIRTSMPNYITGATDGSAEAWNELWNIAVNEGFSGTHAANYNRVRGLNADGTRNPDYPVYLDERNLMVYMLTAHYTADTDCPASGDHPNNLNVVRHRYDGATKNGFVYMRHDAEHSMRCGSDWGNDWGFDWDTTLHGTHAQYDSFLESRNFNPAELQYRLLEHPEYRMKLADFFYREVLRPGGALTVERATERFRSRMAEIDDAIVCESARWGHDDWYEREQGFESVKFRSDWLYACSWRLAFITNRVAHLTRQYRERGWYPSVDAPLSVDAHGVALADGVSVGAGGRVYFDCASAGTVYYTTDGSDPRLEGGALNPSSAVYTSGGIEIPSAGVVLKARLRSASGEWSAIESVSLVGDESAASGVRVAAVMSSTADGGGDGSEFIVLTNLGAAASFDVSGMRITSQKTGKAELSLDLTLPAGLSVPAGGSLTFGKSAFWPQSKITNGAVDMFLYSRDGDVVQTLHFDANWHGNATDGTGAHLVALDFGATVTEGSQWRPSFYPPEAKSAKKSVAAAIEEDGRIREWMDAMGSTQSGQAAISAFAGTKEAVRDAYLVGLDTLVDPEAELRFIDIKFDGSSVRLGGDLDVLGEEWRNRVNGLLKLYRYETLGAQPDVIDMELEDGRFPLIDATGDTTGTYRFFRLRLE